MESDQVAGFQIPRNNAKVLVYRIGSLGDSIVALPAVWAVKQHFGNAQLDLLTDHNSRFVANQDVYGCSAIFSDYLSYDPATTKAHASRTKLAQWLRVLRIIRSRRYAAFVYLVPSERTIAQRIRDWSLFRTTGIPQFIGFRGFFRFPKKTFNGWIASVPKESELLLRRIAASGIAVPAPDKGSLDLRIGPTEHEKVTKWLSTLVPDLGRPWLAVGPGGKKSTHLWPTDRFGEVIQCLIQRYDLWPVVFGGAEDQASGQHLIEGWGRGYVAAGSLDVRSGVAALSNCALFVGNDTGTAHMAAAAGRQCVIVQPSVRPPGQWTPYGSGHRVVRAREGRPIEDVTVDAVIAACAKIMQDYFAAEISLTYRM